MLRARTTSAPLATAAALGVAIVAVAATGRAEPPASAPPASASPPASAPPPASASASASAPAPAEKPPRPPPLPPLETKTPAWERHLEIGGDLVIGTRPASHDATGAPSGISYRPAVGFGLHARWPLWKYLRFTAYFADLHHSLRVPTGSLGLAGATYDIGVAQTFVFGARLAPTLPFGERGRAWVSVGAGWGRFEFPRSKVTLAGDPAPSTLYEQAFSFVEIPFSLGASFDIVKRWLAFEVELSAGVFTGQRGDALDGRQVIDAGGRVRHTTGFPVVDASFTQTIGLSLIL